MKKFCCLFAAVATLRAADPGSVVTDPGSPRPNQPQIFRSPPKTNTAPTYSFEQKLLGGKQPLVTEEQAKVVIDRFKTGYSRLGSPRLLIYVSREQTVRDFERFFGRPLRMAGASLADQHVATQLMADKAHGSLASSDDQARKDREALSKLADVAIEVLISSKNVTVPEISGDKSYSVPDIQATAIRLKDAKIMGQASTSDILGKDPRYDVREVTEATALALMEDMLTGVDAPAAASSK